MGVTHARATELRVWVYRGAGVIAAELRHTAPAAIELGEGWRAVQCGQGIAEGLGRTGLGLWSCLAWGFEGWVLHRGHLSDVGYSPRGGELRGDGRGILEGQVGCGRGIGGYGDGRRDIVGRLFSAHRGVGR